MSRALGDLQAPARFLGHGGEIRVDVGLIDPAKSGGFTQFYQQNLLMFASTYGKKG